MTVDEHQRVIDELQSVINDTQHTLDRFEVACMEDKMPEDYDRLLAILDDAVTQQRAHTLAMLSSVT